MGNLPTAAQLEMEEVRELRRILRAIREPGEMGYGLVTFQTKGVQPPSPEYLTRDSYLQLNVLAVVVGVTYVVAAKILTPDGKITVSQWLFTPAASGTVQQYLTNLTEGFLLSCTVTVIYGATLHRGMAFVQLGVQFGPAASTPMYRILISGYVTTTVSLAWPEGTLMDSLTGPGYLQISDQANPSAGADWLVTIGSLQRFWLHSCTCTLVTSSTAGSRVPIFTIKDSGGKAQWQMGPTAAQTASTTVIYNLGEALTLSADVSGNKVIALPEETYLYQSWSIGSVTSGLLAGDQWSNINLAFDTWMEA